MHGHSMQGALVLLLSATIAPVLGMRMRLNQSALTGKDPDPPWRKDTLCYSTYALTKSYVCGRDFKKYDRTPKIDTSNLEELSDEWLKVFGVGDRVQAKYKDQWYEGVVEKLPKDDKDGKGRWTIQCDTDSEGNFLYTSELRPTAQKVQTLGLLDVKSNEKYVVELADDSKSRSDELLGIVLGGGIKAVADVVGTFVPGGGLMTELLLQTISVFVAPDTKHEQLDLTALFEKFEARLKLHNFRNVLDEIQRTYNEFLQWMQELLDPDLAPTELRYQERTVFMIESHLDVARVLFTNRNSVDAGMESYYLFEPLLQQAILHQVVMLIHVCIFRQLGEHKEAIRHVARAKNRYDQYRKFLTNMQSVLLDWREDQVRVGSRPISELTNSTWRKGDKMCKEKWSKGGGHKKVWNEVEVSYTWEDSFEKVSGIPTLRRSRSFEILRTHGTMVIGEDSCSWYGVWSDGRDILEEPEAYAKALKAEHRRYTDSLLAVLDAVWLKLPVEECLDGFELQALEKVGDCNCQSVEDESLPRRLKEHFGPLRQSGTWPGQEPVLDAERYVLCERDRDHYAPISAGNLCVKFL